MKINKYVWVIFVAMVMFLATNSIIEAERSIAYSEGYEDALSLAYAGDLPPSFESSIKKSDSYGGIQSVYPAQETRPYSGQVLYGYEYYGNTITVTADSYDDYVVSLKDFYGNTYISFYVREGETVTMGVPSEILYVHFACGDEWLGYGKSLMFGPDTYYSRDDEPIDFVNYNWTYTLYPVTDGNFSVTPSNADEFF